MLGYALLGMAYRRGLAGSGRPLKCQVALALFWAVCYAAVDEYHQTFTAGRHAASLDVLIDSCGAALGILAALR